MTFGRGIPFSVDPNFTAVLRAGCIRRIREPQGEVHLFVMPATARRSKSRLEIRHRRGCRFHHLTIWRCRGSVSVHRAGFVVGAEYTMCAPSVSLQSAVPFGLPRLSPHITMTTGSQPRCCTAATIWARAGYQSNTRAISDGRLYTQWCFLRQDRPPSAATDDGTATIMRRASTPTRVGRISGFGIGPIRVQSRWNLHRDCGPLAPPTPEVRWLPRWRAPA